jgi:hypothetical protein
MGVVDPGVDLIPPSEIESVGASMTMRGRCLLEGRESFREMGNAVTPDSDKRLE